MTIAGWIFMVVSVVSVLALVIYCVGKVISGAPTE
jgi:Na+-transporting methylmalonyl-CoA/oxaloacetate decarboxylase gamma subunit